MPVSIVSPCLLRLLHRSTEIARQTLRDGFVGADTAGLCTDGCSLQDVYCL